MLSNKMCVGRTSHALVRKLINAKGMVSTIRDPVYTQGDHTCEQTGHGKQRRGACVGCGRKPSVQLQFQLCAAAGRPEDSSRGSNEQERSTVAVPPANCRTDGRTAGSSGGTAREGIFLHQWQWCAAPCRS
jgi:hypothetical protein